MPELRAQGRDGGSLSHQALGGMGRGDEGSVGHSALHFLSWHIDSSWRHRYLESLKWGHIIDT
jgi:hypothetical protein